MKKDVEITIKTNTNI